MTAFDKNILLAWFTVPDVIVITNCTEHNNYLVWIQYSWVLINCMFGSLNQTLNTKGVQKAKDQVIVWHVYHLTDQKFLGKFPFNISFLGLRRKFDCLGGWWASSAQLNIDSALQLLKNQKEPCSQFPLMLDLCGYLLMNCCDNLSLTESANSAQIQGSNQACVFFVE